MNNLSAAVGCAKLENLTKIISAKRNNFKKYSKLLKNFNDVEIIMEPILQNQLLVSHLKCKNLKLKIYLIKNLKKNWNRFTWRPLHQLKIFKIYPKIT